MKNKTAALFLTMILVAGVYACAPRHSQTASNAGVHDPSNNEKRFEAIEEQWGIRPLAIRMTGGGHFLDFRFLVTDGEKAIPVVSRQNKAFLEDQDTGKVYPVPVTKIGPIRATSVKPKEDKQYFILFANSDKVVHKGSRVTVIVDKFKVEDLIVE